MEILERMPMLLVAWVGLVGLMVGSFLNVVIHRLPLMMERGWRRECLQFLGQTEEAAAPVEVFNLAWPGSHCPHCGKSIRLWENIPLLSYVWLKGRCSGCGAGIAWRYPLVEALSAVLSVGVALKFGYSATLLPALLLTWSLLALSFIDLDRQLLPDAIVLPVLWLGLLLSIPGLFTGSASSILGAAAGYLSLWGVYQGFKLLTGKEGMGYGDFKLLAMLGAWLGWQLLPLIILLSSVVGTVVGIAMITLAGHDRRQPIPFGPYLAAAGWLAMMWGDAMTAAYLRWLGLG